MPEDMETLLRFMAAGRLSSRQLHSMTASPESAPAIYDRIFARDPELLGVVFHWNND
jgi:threonine dehydrogenase-like Zn-dependent dehydrogenase